MSEPIALRDYHAETDRAYVASTWVAQLRSERYAGDETASRVNDGYHGRLVDRLLELPDIRIVIACSKPDPRWILGWCVASKMKAGRQPIVLHFVYVRRGRRQEGIAAQMFGYLGARPEIPLVHTFKTSSLRWIRRIFPVLVYMEPEEILR